MHPFLAFARAKQSAIIALIRELVECESPSDHAPSVNHFVDLLATRLEGLGRVRTFPGGRFGRNLRCEFKLPDSSKRRDGGILALAHSDTVWPLGTLAQMPFRNKQGRLWGAGGAGHEVGHCVFSIRGAGTARTGHGGRKARSTAGKFR